MRSFNEIYQELYKNIGEDLKKLKSQSSFKQAIWIAVIIIFAIIAFFTQNAFMWVLFAIALIIIIFFISKEYVKYALVYKEMVIKKFIKGYSENLEYIPLKGIPSSEYSKSGFDSHYDRYKSEDLIEGVILDNCKIKMAEVHTEDEQTSTDSNGHTTTEYVTIFHGLFAKIELNSPSQVNFEIRRNSLIGDIFKGKQKLDMDSNEFEKIFDVKTQDKISTLRILTADVMQLLIDFKNTNKVVPEIILDNNIMYIRFSVGNVFEPNLVKNDMDYDKLKNTYNMINFTFELAKNFCKNIIEFEK